MAFEDYKSWDIKNDGFKLVWLFESIFMSSFCFCNVFKPVGEVASCIWIYIWLMSYMDGIDMLLLRGVSIHSRHLLKVDNAIKCIVKIFSRAKERQILTSACMLTPQCTVFCLTLKSHYCFHDCFHLFLCLLILSLGDNKSIWMIAEENERNKVHITLCHYVVQSSCCVLTKCILLNFGHKVKCCLMIC